MSYESKVIIANRLNPPPIDGYGYAETVAELNLSCMYYNGWKELFTRPIDFNVFVRGEAEETHEDKYGEHMKEADLASVIEWLETHETSYRRARLLLGTLKALDPAEWESLHIVHYGY